MSLFVWSSFFKDVEKDKDVPPKLETGTAPNSEEPPDVVTKKEVESDEEAESIKTFSKNV